MDRGREVRRPEIWPHAVGEPQLGVGAFPQQEVREALLAAGTNEEIDIGQQVPALDRCAGGVVDRDAELELGPACGPLFGGHDRVDE